MNIRLLVLAAIGSLSLALLASSDVNEGIFAVSDADTILADNRRKERRDDRGDNRDDKQDCRQEEGLVGDDKRECKQENRGEGDDEAEPEVEAEPEKLILT
jgi:hypothetical protein